MKVLTRSCGARQTDNRPELATSPGDNGDQPFGHQFPGETAGDNSFRLAPAVSSRGVPADRRALVLLLLCLLVLIQHAPWRQHAVPDSVAFAQPGEVPSPEPINPLFLHKPLPINHATVEDLVLLPGIGRQRAQAIVQLRESRGPLRCAEDLLRVNGIGPHQADTLRPWLLFN